MKALTKETYKIFLKHISRYIWVVVFAIFVQVVAVASDVYAPYVFKQIFDLVGVGDPSLTPSIIKLVYLVVGVSVISWLGWRVATFLINFLQPRIMTDLLNTCFEYLQNHSYNFFTSNFAGSLVRKVNRFERAFEDIADQFYWHLFQAVLKVGFIIIVLFLRQWILGLIVFVWVLIYGLFNIAFAKFKLKYDVQRADADTKATGHLADTITNNINLKVFDSLGNEFKFYKKLTWELFRLRKLAWDLGAVSEAVQSALIIILQFAMLYAAVIYWQKGILTIGDFVLIQLYIAQIFGRLWDLGRYVKQIYERLADAEEMTQILITPHEVADVQEAKKLHVENGKIEFFEVTFSYAKKNKTKIFDRFNLTIKPGERVAIIGPSGGGKSTIVKLLFRFFDLSSGKILIDNQDISQVTQGSLRDNLALVPQDPILFHRSLYDNIKYGRLDATDTEVYTAAKLAHCHEFIIKLMEGYRTFVGERGIKLSGGERQRVAIARAILKNAPILVLDEATSSLDSESEYYIQDALKQLMRNKTTIVIAHRLSTIMQMDRIVVLDGGKVIEEGRHEELLKIKKGLYQKLWGIQAGGFTK